MQEMQVIQVSLAHLCGSTFELFNKESWQQLTAYPLRGSEGGGHSGAVEEDQGGRVEKHGSLIVFRFESMFWGSEIILEHSNKCTMF